MTIQTAELVNTPGYVAGTWDVDAVHSEVSFVVRHMVVSKVRGRFDRFTATIVTAEDPLQSSVEAAIDAASVNTYDPQRDAHVRSADFLDTEHYPEIAFQSTGVRPASSGFFVDGNLSIRGITRPVTLALELNGFTEDPFGGTRAGFSASTEINRDDFGVSYNGPMPGAGSAVIVSNRVTLMFEIEAVRRPEEA